MEGITPSKNGLGAVHRKGASFSSSLDGQRWPSREEEKEMVKYREILRQKAMKMSVRSIVNAS